MHIYEDENLKNYKENNLALNPDWRKRDFVNVVERYLNGSTEKILVVGGLRGTGKTVGILQAASGKDLAYILTQKDENETGKDYIDYLKNTQKKYIAFDEYSWIKDRDALDRFLLTSVQNDKRIVITATESVSLEFLNYGSLNHRADVIHTTMFTYGEYLRLYDKPQNKTTCKEFLMEGGLFKDYALKNFDSTKAYVEEAIVRNIAGYLKDEMSEEKARALTYSVIYKAVCPSNLSSVPTLRNKNVTLNNFLEEMGVYVAIVPKEKEINRVADIFEQAGLIVRIPNYVDSSPIKEQYYITNPSLTCQIIMAVYNLQDMDNSMLGHVFESCAAVQLATNKLYDHQIYFYNTEKPLANNTNKELDFVITDKERGNAYFFECKYTQSAHLHSDITLLSGYLEQHDFKDVEIEGRYVIYNGKPSVRDDYSVGRVIFTPLSNMLDNYFEFEVNSEKISNQPQIHNKRSGIEINDNTREIIEQIAKDSKGTKKEIENSISEKEAQAIRETQKEQRKPHIKATSNTIRMK